jgi:hypothetical protein
MCPVCLFTSAALIAAGTTSTGGGLATLLLFKRKPAQSSEIPAGETNVADESKSKNAA